VLILPGVAFAFTGILKVNSWCSPVWFRLFWCSHHLWFEKHLHRWSRLPLFPSSFDSLLRVRLFLWPWFSWL